MLLSYLRRTRRALGFALGMLLILLAVFYAYRLPLEALGYAAALALALGLVLFFLGYGSFLRRHRELQRLLGQLDEQVLPLPQPLDALERDYGELLSALGAERLRLQGENRRHAEDMRDYYTTWAHQIKTPIAAAHLLLAQGASGTELEVELLKIEQYTDMVLGYLRLDSETSDYVLHELELDPLVRASVRRLAKLFVLKKIKFELQETHIKTVSDEKWLSFVLEQLLTNALKYTPAGGSIRIWAEGEELFLADTGIGICPEDLPRVFDKGFTGYNGRLGRKSTGIGLYLCRRTLDKLGHGITISSTPGKGTTVQLSLGRKRVETE